MIKGTESYRDQILQHRISGCGYPQHRGLWVLFLPAVSVPELFSFLTRKKKKNPKQPNKTNQHDKTPCFARCHNYSLLQSPGSSLSPSPTLVLACYLPCHNSTNPTEPVSFKFQLGPWWPVNESTERRKTHSVELCLVLLADLESEMLEALT